MYSILIVPFGVDSQTVDFKWTYYLTGTISQVHFDWIIRNITLTGHVSEALENSTWATSEGHLQELMSAIAVSGLKFLKRICFV